MKLGFHLTTPEPPAPRLDAAVQEVDRLRAHFGGDLMHLYPAAQFRRWIPRAWLTAAHRRRLLAVDASVDLHHLASDHVPGYSVLDRLTKPVVLRLMTSPRRSPGATALARFAAIAVSSPADASRLTAWGARRVAPIPPAFDVERLRSCPPPPVGPFTLMMGSAPWTRRQFRTKGLAAVLDVVGQDPGLRLILLWRGCHRNELDRRLASSPAAPRVEVVDHEADVARLLERVHAVLLPAASSRVVKAYPHSLLEALIAGRPVITSSVLGIAHLVEDLDCGLLAEPSTAALTAAIHKLRNDYDRYRQGTSHLDVGPFTPARHLADYQALYEGVLEDAADEA